MGHFSSMFNGLARSLSIKRTKSLKNNDGNYDARKAVESMVKDAKKNDLILRTSGIVNIDGSKNLASVFSKRGEKGVNQDCCIVWEEFGCQEDMIFCGIFDGHGSWGHFVAKSVRESMPTSLLYNWQETLAKASTDPDFDLKSDQNLQRFDVWKHSYLKACASVDHELERNPKLNAFHSGTTALTVVRQGDMIFLANVGDSRAVLGSISDDGNVVAVPLTIDHKPNLPYEAERIIECNGRVHCLEDEPGVHRVWLPDEEFPGLAMSRAFGDYCIKDFGLVSVPEVSQRHITSKDQFIILATDGVWDVVSSDEAVQIISTAPEPAKSANHLVKWAGRAWKRKRKGISMDDMFAIVLFFHSSTVQHHVQSISPASHS